MTSNLKINRICEYCSKEFIAQTTTTRYCSKKCNSAHYKAKKRSKKIDQSNKQTNKIKNEPIEQIKAKAFLTVKDVAILLNCSTRTVYRMIGQGDIKAINLSQRKTLVKRSDLDKLFEKPNP